MKKIFAAVLALVLLASFACPALASQYAYVKTPTPDGTVYVRTQAGAGKPIAGVANSGETLLILKVGNTWHKVRVIRTGVEGWMYGEYIKFISSAPEEPTPVKPEESYTPDASRSDTDKVINRLGSINSKDGYANLRWGPGTDYPVIKKVYAGTTVRALEKNGSWYRCAVGGNTVGYINANLLTLGATISDFNGMEGTVSSGDGYANVRETPSLSGYLLYSLATGKTANAYSSSGDWIKISRPESWNDAFIYRELLRFYHTATTTGNVNIRKGPSTSYGKDGVLSSGTKVILLATDGSFCRVDTGSKIGYVSKKYLDF